jgi:superfamily II DNA or RNA helicase
MAYQLRPYQTDLISRIAQSWYDNGNRRVLCQLPTGAGKSIVLSSIVQSFNDRGMRVLVLAHREELVNQLIEKIEAIVNEPVGVIKAGIKPNFDRDIQVGSVQSTARRLESYADFDLIIIDECHHTVSKSYTNILDRYPTAKVLGVTATPIRLDGKGFRGVFDDLICGVTVTELIEMGSLSPYKYYGAERSMSVAGIKKTGGDYAASAVEAENPSEVVANQVIEAYRRHLQGKQSVVFAVSVAHSIAIAQALNSVGIITHHLDGMTDSAERKSTMQLFRDKKIQCLTNCALFDEGLDIPSLDGVILARPTASLSRFLQMAGRSLRTAEDKEYATIIDLAGNYERLGMPDDDRTWTLDGIEKKKRDKKATKVRKRNEITDEVELVSIFDTGTQFIEIAGSKTVLTAELNQWIELCDSIIAECIEKGHKAAWCAYRMMASDIQPPLEAWKYLGKKIGYHHGWSKYKFEEWQAK